MRRVPAMLDDDHHVEPGHLVLASPPINTTLAIVEKKRLKFIATARRAVEFKPPDRAYQDAGAHIRQTTRITHYPTKYGGYVLNKNTVAQCPIKFR